MSEISTQTLNEALEALAEKEGNLSEVLELIQSHPFRESTEQRIRALKEAQDEILRHMTTHTTQGR